MEIKNPIFQLDTNTLRVAGVGLWTYNTVERVLWYSGFADTIHVTSEPLCVDIDLYVDIVDKKDQQRVIDYMSSMHSPNPAEGLRYMIHGDNQDFYIDNRVVSSTPMEGGFLVRGYAQNITRQIVLEQELERALRKEKHSDRLKSAFVANISHEFRTPITAITGFSALVMQCSDKIERQQYMAIVEENSARLLRLINTLIDLSEIQVGSYQFKYASFNISALLDRLIEDHKPKFSDGVCVVNNTSTSMRFKEVVSDENAISVVFSNLLTNAIKHTVKGQIALGYEIDDSGAVTCYVTDTGAGMSKEQQQKIFEKFYQNNSFDDGMGLGLPLCQLIIQELGGQIKVESTLNLGTTFQFILHNS